jgi:hypothetical protein
MLVFFVSGVTWISDKFLESWVLPEQKIDRKWTENAW